MNRLRFRRWLSREVTFVVVGVVLWATALSILPGDLRGHPFLSLLFGLVVSLVSLWLIETVGAFDPFRLLSRKSDILVTFLTMALCGWVTTKLAHRLLGLVCASGWQVLGISAGIGIATFLSQAAVSRYRRLRQLRRKIVLDLLPHEREQVILALSERGVVRDFIFLNRQDLKEHLIRAAADEIDAIVISRAAADRFDVGSILLRAHLSGIPVVDYERFVSELTNRIDLKTTDLWSYLLAATPQTAFRRAFAHMKLVLEPIMAIIVGILFLPVMGVVAAVIRWTSPGPILYRQIRTGYSGRNFVLYKFRSMVANAEAAGPQWCSVGDSRITPIGRFIRKTRLDELPQLWNVIRGDMSFVGPRPERPEIYQSLKREIPLFSLRTLVRPGITGLAQVSAGYAASVEESAEKLSYDLYYIQNMSPRVDLVIIFRTIEVMILGAERIRRRRAGAQARAEPEGVAVKGETELRSAS